MKAFQCIALTPPGITDPSIAIAACRAGELGVLDLEHAEQDETTLAAIAKLARFAHRACGIKIDGRDEEFLTWVTSDLPDQVKVVILTQSVQNTLRPQVKALHNRNLTVLLEITCLEEALTGVKAEVDGLIAKGNEAGGWVAEETTFVLLQRVLNNVSLPVWAQGGIGLHTSAACYAAGAAGVVLDSQLALTRESPFPETLKKIIAGMDGSESVCIGCEIGVVCRVYAEPRSLAVKGLIESENNLVQDSRSRTEIVNTWRKEVSRRAGGTETAQNVWLLGQDVSFASSLAGRFKTVGGVLEGIRQSVDAHVQLLHKLKPLSEKSPLALSHGTRYPIVQGPMARISDNAAFLLNVAEEGGLPFFALGMSQKPEIEEPLHETCQLLKDYPWGVGILGFAPYDILNQQMELIKTYRPPFALIAGGRPEQAIALEHDGIATYLHVPSSGLLKLFLDNGIRRFVFEGRECGGHIGPRSSFVLWDQIIDVLLESLPESDLSDCHVLFAGGIHDARSSSMVSTLAAPLAERGVKVGIQMGTAYLLTKEIVAAGAIVKGYQEEAIKCSKTVILETGPGHASRCAATAYVEDFKNRKRQLITEQKSAAEITGELEKLSLGRLRAASKGIDYSPEHAKKDKTPKYKKLKKTEQLEKGMYMIGQAAVLHGQSFSISELHHDVSVNGSQLLSDLENPGLSCVSIQQTEKPCDIAIIGMACLLPKSPNLQSYWENILGKVNAITEVPKDHWDWKLYYDQDPKTRDKINSRWGAFLDKVTFDPTAYGMPPNKLESIEPLHLLALKTAHTALQDAGYDDRPFPRERTSVIVGGIGGFSELFQRYSFRSNLSRFIHNVPTDLLSIMPEWTEDSFAGILTNVAAGRIANFFDFGGVNYTVDAACATSLAVIYSGIRELKNKASDIVLVGSADTCQTPFTYTCFSKAYTFSPDGQSRPFDTSANGIVMGEGIAFLVLKRLDDAERDGDRIYAVIKSVEGSSDGRGKGMSAPNIKGQSLALKRAYDKAGVSPASVGLVEAHGTGTVVGDRVEINVLRRLFKAKGAVRQSCVIGSVKSMIGHTKSTAGMAGLIKVAMALHHKVLPPTIGVEKPNSTLSDSPFYINTDPRPWINGAHISPRRAGVSSFGFGGTNFHAVIEEYTNDFLVPENNAVLQNWPSELFLWTGSSREELLSKVCSLKEALDRGAEPKLSDLSYTLWEHSKKKTGFNLAIVAASLTDLVKKLTRVEEQLKSIEHTRIHDPGGMYYTEEPLFGEGKVAFLFPGQGSQYPDMLCNLTIQFPEVREQFEIAERVLSDRFPRPLSAYIYPPQRFSEEAESDSKKALAKTNIAQPALGAANMGLYHLLIKLGIEPNMAAGHSYGEYTALCAAGIFNEEGLYHLSETRGRLILEEAGQDLGTMAAVEAEPESIIEIIESVQDVWLSNLNSPKQTVISGSKTGVKEAVKKLEERGINSRPIAVSCAFHSPMVSPVRDRLKEFLSTLKFCRPEFKVFSNTTADLYPQEVRDITALLSEHLVNPVKFTKEIEAMYESGARIFIEVGPRRVLTNLTQQILGKRPYLAVPVDIPDRNGIFQLHHVLGQLAAHNVPINLDRLYQGRPVRSLDLNSLIEETRVHYTPTTWLVDGSRARPLQKADSDKLPVKPSTQEKASHADEHKASPDEPRKTAADPILAVDSADDVPGSPSPDDEVHSVMLNYQRLMHRFLEVQQQVMQAFLDGSSSRIVPLEAPALMKPVEGLKASYHTLPPLEQIPPASGQPPEQTIANRGSSLSQPESTGYTEPSRAAEPESQSVVPAMDIEQIKKQLLLIVSDRTGYPPEMLDLDLDLEADLGVDSIKRTEILGIVRQEYPNIIKGENNSAMEELSKIKTLRGIIDWISNSFQTQTNEQEDETLPAQQEAVADCPSVEGGDEAVKVPRFLLRAVDAPLNDLPLQIPSDSVFLITSDGGDISLSLADKLRQTGGHVALVQMGDEVGETGSGLYTANLRDPSSVFSLVELVRQQQGPIAGVIHLLPLKAGITFKEMELKDWQASLRQGVKSLFYITKAAGKDLAQSARAGGGWVVAATSVGGTFYGGSREGMSPEHGGIAGLLKTIAQEWPDVNCKAVDFDSKVPASYLVDCLISEMAVRNGDIEIGYRNSRRQIIRTEVSPLNKKDFAGLEIDSDWVIMVTGGTRGITAETAIELARQYHPTLLLVGLSPLPSGEESSETAGITAPADLKKALIDKFRRSGRDVKLNEVETAYKKLCREREIRKNIIKMKESGAKVQYFQADVRDEHSFGDLIDRIYRDYGRLDVVIHGAGIIEDKLLLDKLPDSFDRVFDTKADSAFILSKKLRPDSLKFLVFFSSVSGCFGSRGQCDYAATNDVVNKLALYLDKQWTGRIIAINWGPWDKEAGMVSSELQKQFVEQGVQLIPRTVGSRLVDREIRFGRKGEGEIVIGDGPWANTPPVFPLLEGIRLQRTNVGTVEVERTLDTDRDLYLNDHVLDGKPVFPVAMAMELMAEVAQQGWPELSVIGIHSLRVFRGIVLDSRSKKIQVLAKPRADQSGKNSFMEVELTISDHSNPGHPNFRAIVQLADRLPEPPPFDQSGLPELGPFPKTVEETYKQWLFHGPCFQGITEIDGISKQGISVKLRSFPPGECFSHKPGGQWLLDPVVLDSSFQPALLWERVNCDMTPLPSAITSFQKYGSLSSSPLQCYLQTKKSSDGILIADIYLWDATNRLVGFIDKMEFSCSKALNRLAGHVRTFRANNQ